MASYLFTENNLIDMEKMNNFWENKKLVDFKVEVKGKIFTAHKFILALIIPFFDLMFDIDLVVTTLNTTTITDELVTAEAFEMILDFCYTGMITISSTNALSLLACSSYLSVNNVKEWCFQVIQKHITVENVLEIYSVAKKIKFIELIDLTKEFMKDNFDEISQFETFINLNVDEIKEIISDDNLNVSSEDVVYEVLVKWVKFDESNRKAFLPSLIKCIRFTLISKEYFVDQISEECLLTESKECVDLIKRINKFFLFPEKTSLVEDLCKKARTSSKSNQFIFTIKRENGEIYIFNNENNNLTKLEVNNQMNFDKYFNTTVNNNKIYAIGGAYNNDTYFNKVRIFDYSTRKWSEGPSMNEPRRNCAVTSLGNKIYVFGGLNKEGRLNSVECLDIEEQKWKFLSPMSTKRSSIKAITLNTDIYVFGGLDEEENELNSVEKFDTTQEKWFSVKEMNTRRYFYGVEKMNEKIYVAGARKERHDWIDSVEVFDSTRNEWSFE